MIPLVKVCGLRRLSDAELSLELGARFLGCVVAADSPRRASIDEVRRIAAAAASQGDRVPRAEVVLVFRGQGAAELLAMCEATGVRRVQIHGTSPAACRMLAFHGIQLHPVFRVPSRATRLPDLDPVPAASRPAVLDGGSGGAGLRFAWELLAEGAPDATLIAGGITPDNVSELLRYRPFGIDLSSGVETGPGVKDGGALRELFARVHGSAAPREEVGS